MTVQVKDEIIAKIGEAENAIRAYMAKTNEIINTDIDETLEGILAERQSALEQIDAVTKGIYAFAAENCDETEQKYIENALHNRHLPLGLSAEMKEIRRAAVKMHSVYSEAMTKDSIAAKRVDARVKELRASLEELNDDKRKIDFYSHNKIGAGKGGSLNTKL